MKTQEITNRENLIDSREVIERIEWLESTIEELTTGEPGGDTTERSAELDEYQQELDNLNALDSEGRDTFGEEWKYGVTLINDDYFEEYAQELASDIGAINDDMAWPATCIDWERAASELQMDYTSVEFASQYYSDQQTFWGRA